MIALLSSFLERWQSVHDLGVRMARQVGARIGRPAVLRMARLVPDRRPAADRVRHVGAERDPRHPLARDRLLLDVDRLAIGVVRADVDGARRPRRADPVAGRVAVAGQHEHVVAEGLEVVGDVVARDVALVVELGHLLVGALGQVAAEAARVPRRVAGDAVHLLAGVGAGLLLAVGDVAPDDLVSALEADGLGEVGDAAL